MGSISRLHSFDELVQILAESAFRVCHSDERVGLVLQNSFTSCDCWVDDADDSETSLQVVLEAGGLDAMSAKALLAGVK